MLEKPEFSRGLTFDPVRKGTSSDNRLKEEMEKRLILCREKTEIKVHEASYKREKFQGRQGIIFQMK